MVEEGAWRRLLELSSRSAHPRIDINKCQYNIITIPYKYDTITY
jgi:hypothetical protein